MKPLIEVTTNRYYHLLVLPFAGGLGYLFFWLSFLSEEPIFEDDATGRAVLIALIFVALLICFMAIRSFLANKPLFSVYEDGFVANTHGVASNKVLWKDIDRIEERTVENSDGKPENVLAVFFKDPNYFAYSKSRTLGRAIRLANIGKAYVEGNFSETEAPLLIPVGSLGTKYQEIKAIINREIGSTVTQRNP